MPNPVKKLNPATFKRLSKRQKTMVANLKKKFGNRNLYTYRRKGNNNKISVHNPTMDIRRKAKIGSDRSVKKYPHASDTKKQSGKVPKSAFKKGRVKGKGLLDMFFP